MTATPTPAAVLMPLSDAARLVGVTPRALSSALMNRDIPISRVRLGKRHFVRAAELNQWLAAPAPPTAVVVTGVLHGRLASAVPSTTSADLFR